MVKSLDKDESGQIDFDEFLHLIEHKLIEHADESFEHQTEEDMLQVAQAIFNEFDVDGRGSISTLEMHKVFRSMGVNPTEQELQDLIKEVDADNSGMIEFEEFK